MSSKHRERFAIKGLLQAIMDEAIVFYIQDKDPRTLDAACTLYERYEALAGSDKRTVASRSLRPVYSAIEITPYAEELRSVQEGMDRLRGETRDQIRTLSDTIGRWNATMKTASAFQTNSNEPPVVLSAPCANAEVPKKPCPHCHNIGHWKRDCPQLKNGGTRNNNGGSQSQCFECKGYGHRWRNCSQLSGNGR